MKQNREVANDRTSLLKRIHVWIGSNRHRGAVLATAAVILTAVVGGVAIATTGGLLASSDPTTTTTTLPSAATTSTEVTSTTVPQNGSTTSISPTPTTLAPPTTASRNSPSTTAAPLVTDPTTPPVSTTSPAITTPGVPTSAPPPTNPANFERAFTVDVEDRSGQLPLGDPGVAIEVNASDNGGYITKISVNWQAGEDPEVTNYDISACTLTSTGRPNSAHSERFVHEYEAAGSYLVVVAVTSSDCAGNNSRTVFGQVDVTAVGAA